LLMTAHNPEMCLLVLPMIKSREFVPEIKFVKTLKTK
jgi:hypothetical protein